MGQTKADPLQESDAGYVHSPKANDNGARNVSSDNLTRFQRVDVASSYAYRWIGSIGLVAAEGGRKYQ